MTRCLKSLAKGLLILGLAATPAMAQEEPNGYPISDVNLRAGPGTEYPVLVTVPTDAPITILGCLEDFAWCDTIFEEQRGWMRSIYLAGYYDGEYYLLSDYAPDLGYQVLTFDRAAYWDAYYQDEPFYNDQYRVTEARGEDWVDDGVFYDRLSTHGSWTWTQGQYVWVPTGIDAGWRPYTRGRWIYTDYGWTWASNEPFGWATYHYGRWGFSNRIGWFWVPGNRWGPAWVSWRQSDDYLAWAPLPPSYDRGGLSINISFGDIPNYYWSAVPSRNFLSDDLPRYYVRDRARWRNIYGRTRPIGHTTIINRTVVNNTVNVSYVERHTNTKVVERKVRRTRDWDRAGRVRGDDYEVYRPGLREGRGHHRPNRPSDIDEVAKLSKTRDFARGEAATDDLLAPPEVRDAIKKRKDGRVRGEDRRPRELSRKTDGPKFDRPLPKGGDAEGPPPARKKVRAEPVPAHDFGRSRGGPDGKRIRKAGPQESATLPDRTGTPLDRAKPKDRNGPPQARLRKEGPDGPKGPPQARAKPKDQKGPPPQARLHKEGPDGPKGLPQARAKPKDQKSPAAKPKASAQEAKRQPQAKKARAKPKARPSGKPKASAQEAKRQPQAKKAQAKPKARPGGKPKASAQEAKRQPQAKKTRAKPKARPGGKPKASAQALSANLKPRRRERSPRPQPRSASRTKATKRKKIRAQAKEVALGANEKHVHQKPADHHQSDQHFYQHSGKCAHR